MKIINQSADEMVLKEGDISILLIGAIIVVFGIYFSFSILSSGNLNAAWIPLILLAVGLLCLFVSSSILVTINKTNNQITYQKKSLVGGSSSTSAISDVLRVETRQSWEEVSTTRPGQNGISVQVPRERLVTQSVIMLKDGTELALDRKNSRSNFLFGGVGITPGAGKQIAIATQVANFMGVPFQEIQPPSAGIGLNIGGTNVQL